MNKSCRECCAIGLTSSPPFSAHRHTVCTLGILACGNRLVSFFFLLKSAASRNNYCWLRLLHTFFRARCVNCEPVNPPWRYDTHPLGMMCIFRCDVKFPCASQDPRRSRFASISWPDTSHIFGVDGWTRATGLLITQNRRKNIHSCFPICFCCIPRRRVLSSGWHSSDCSKK